jgi:hypothetical protein
MTGPSANYCWHQGLALGAPEHLDICIAIKYLWPLQKSYQCIWWGVDKKILKLYIHAKGARAHELILNSVTARGWGMGIVYLIEERSLITTCFLTHLNL